jgi:hypothetical protein
LAAYAETAIKANSTAYADSSHYWPQRKRPTARPMMIAAEGATRLRDLAACQLGDVHLVALVRECAGFTSRSGSPRATPGKVAESRFS